MNCSNCDTTNDAGARFCINCPPRLLFTNAIRNGRRVPAARAAA